MLLKFVQLFLMTMATSDVLARSIFTPRLSALFASLAAVISTGIFLGFSCKANPYVDPLNDKMELVSKITLIVTPVFVLIAALVSSEAMDMIVGILLNITAVIGNFFMIWMTVSAMACCKTRMKKFSGSLAFSSPDGISVHNDSETLPDWDLDVERKRRIW